MLSQTTEYALRAVVHLASKMPAAQTTSQISDATKVPRAYLAKVIQALVRGGILTSQRGVNGGVLLVKPLAELTMLDVVNAVDPIKRIKTCPLGLSSHGTRLCPLHAKLDRALADAERAFGGTSLAEILQEPSPSTPLCDFPSKVASEETTASTKKTKGPSKKGSRQTKK